MAFEMLDLTGKSKPRVFALVAGESGIGKTTQVTTFPTAETLFVSVEDGHLSIQGSGIDAVKIDTCDDLYDVLNQVDTWPHQYIYIDSLSEIYDMIKREAKDKFTPAQNFQKFDYINSSFLGVVKRARAIGNKDIYFTCHVKEEKNGIVLEKELSFDGKTPVEVKKQFDLIVHMDKNKNSTGEEVRVLITDPTISKIAKARVSPFMGVTIESVEEANLYELTRKLKGEK